ncbi:hypothetical protein ACFLYQ_05820 [Chloroflexota bacterium]
MPIIEFDLSCLSRARELFIPGDSNDTLIISLEELGAELSNRVGAFNNAPQLLSSMRKYLIHSSKLVEAITYASDRLTDILVRHQQIIWMRQALDYKAESDIIAQVSDSKAASWRMFLGLAIKDFHQDVSSLMDSLAPVIIQANGQLKSVDKVRLPGWEAITSRSRNGRNYRKQLSTNIAKIVDKAESWWAGIREVRHLVTHRKHDMIVFGNPEDGLLFQIYDQARSPKILLPQVLYHKGYNVVDFDLYSAFVIAEVVMLLDDLGVAIAPMMQIPRTSYAQMSLRMVDKSLALSIERLIQLCDTTQL